MAGARFRPQGRDAAGGFDCVGLAVAAYAAAGCDLPAPRGYPLRGWDRAQIVDALRRAGFVAVTDCGRAGDVVLLALPAGQFHLGLRGLDRIVHAHAGLRRVVEAPLDALWLASAHYRLIS